MLNPEAGFGRTFSIVIKSEDIPRKHQGTVNFVVLFSTFHGTLCPVLLYAFSHWMCRPILVTELSLTWGPDSTLKTPSSSAPYC